jgi:CRISPR/Cas system-associated exonuclease Cas4 (RecB family)
VNKPSVRIPMLSKTRYSAGLQCPLRLWMTCYNPELASETSPVKQALFDSGHQVGVLSTGLFPGGVLVGEDHLHHEEAVQTTLKAMGDPRIKAIYEAGFFCDSVRIRADILERLGNGKWNLIEVKSSTKAKEEHIPDVGIQYYVLRDAGVQIDRVFLMHLNNQYVYDGNELDLRDLFTSSDLTDEALRQKEEIPRRLAGLNEMLGRDDPPEVLPSRHCKTPYLCEFWEHCTREAPEHPVWELAGISQKRLDELSAMGIRDIHDIPDAFPLNEMQDRIRTCVKDNEEFVDPDLKRELEDVAFPAHFLDFETLGPAIPRYAGTRPYQNVPFQWSDHIVLADGSVEHREFLYDKGDDPRGEFTQTLLDALGSEGTIYTYTDYEEKVIKGLAKHHLQYKDRLLATLGRIRDLHKIVSKHYYHPNFHGSFSVKSVLPALLPDMGYGELAIQDGQEAGLE